MSIGDMPLTKSPFSHGSAFPNPFYDIASTYLPRDIKRTFVWCEYLYFNGTVVKAATDRIIQYFITEIQYKSNTKNTDKLKEVLEKQLKIKSVLINIGKDYLTYGNSINSIFFPFIRGLKCPACGLEINAKKLPEYDYDNEKFKGKCPCGETVQFKVIQRKDFNTKKIGVIRIDPKALKIKRHPLSGATEYYWQIPKEYIHKVKNEKDEFFINDTPGEVLHAIAEDEAFKWSDSYIHHIKLPTLAGFPLEWGCPIFLHVLKLNYYASILRRANETIALDFVVPFRVLSPGSNSPNFDPAMQYQLGDFAAQMNSMVRRHRYDPADIQIAPFPVNYQAFGAENKALDVTAEIKSVIEEMLHTLNYPAELFFNTLRIQSFPPALRLFENTWSDLVTGLNGFLQWLTDHITTYMRWPREEVELTKVTIADDIEKRQVLLQLASAQQISMLTALKAYGLDFKDEQKKIADQQKILMDVQREMQEEMAVEQQLSEGGQGQAMPDINTEAQLKAQEMLKMPHEYRVRALRQLEQMNPTLHAMTKQIMEKARNMSRSQMGLENLAAAGMTGHQVPPEGGMPPM